MCRNEPRLDQLLADPLIRLMMSSDGVDEGEIRRLARGHAARAARRAAERSAWAGAARRSGGASAAFACAV